MMTGIMNILYPEWTVSIKSRSFNISLADPRDYGYKAIFAIQRHICKLK